MLGQGTARVYHRGSRNQTRERVAGIYLALQNPRYRTGDNDDTEDIIYEISALFLTEMEVEMRQKG